MGGPNRPIVIYTSQPGSGTRSQWDTFMGGSSDKCLPLANKPGGGGPQHVIFENAPAPIIANGDVAGAMFHYSQGRFTENSESTKTPPRMFLGSVNGARPHARQRGRRLLPVQPVHLECVAQDVLGEQHQQLDDGLHRREERRQLPGSSADRVPRRAPTR